MRCEHGNVMLNKVANYFAGLILLAVYLIGVKTGPAFIAWLKG